MAGSRCGEYNAGADGPTINGPFCGRPLALTLGFLIGNEIPSVLELASLHQLGVDVGNITLAS